MKQPRFNTLAQVVIAAAAVVLALAARGAGAEPTFYYDVTLKLEGALFLGNKADDPRDLELYLGVRDGQWDPHVMG